MSHSPPPNQIVLPTYTKPEEKAKYMNHMINACISDKIKHKNFLFLEPVPLQNFPTYLSIVQRPIDLGTIKKRLDAGEYKDSTCDAFDEDVLLCFYNCIAFNRTRGKDGSAIVSIGKWMKNFYRRTKVAFGRAIMAGNEPGESNHVSNSNNNNNNKRSPKGSGSSKKQKGRRVEAEDEFESSSSDDDSYHHSNSGASNMPQQPPSFIPPPAVMLLDDVYDMTIQYSPNASFDSDPQIKMRCIKAISVLKRLLLSDPKLQKSAWSMFKEPVKLPVAMMNDYNAKILRKSDFLTVCRNVYGHKYHFVRDFVSDVRRIFSNCIRFNSHPTAKATRDLAIHVYNECEDVLLDHLTRKYVKPVLPTYKMCMQIMWHIYDVPDPDNPSIQLCDLFLHPVSVYFGGQFPPGYLDVVKRPMDYGTIIENLLTAEYSTLNEFEMDMSLVSANCKTFYLTQANGEDYISKARKLHEGVLPQLKVLRDVNMQHVHHGGVKKGNLVYNGSPRIMAKEPMTDILNKLKRFEFHSARMNKDILAITPFVNPVERSFVEYHEFIRDPMDWSTVFEKVQNCGSTLITRRPPYNIPEEFEYDVNLIFENALRYNGYGGPNQAEGGDLCFLAQKCQAYFCKLFEAYQKKFFNPIEAEKVLVGSGGVGVGTASGGGGGVGGGGGGGGVHSVSR